MTPRRAALRRPRRRPPSRRRPAAVESSAPPADAGVETRAAGRTRSPLDGRRSVGSDDGAARGPSSPAPPAAVARASAAVESSATPGDAALEQDALAAAARSTRQPPVLMTARRVVLRRAAPPASAVAKSVQPARSQPGDARRRSAGAGRARRLDARGGASVLVMLGAALVELRCRRRRQSANRRRTAAPDSTSFEERRSSGMALPEPHHGGCIMACCRAAQRLFDSALSSQDMGGAPPVGEGDHVEPPTAPAAPPTVPDATPPEPGIPAPRTPTPPPAAPMDTEPTVAPTIEPSDGRIPKKEGRWDHAEHEAFLRCLDEFDRDYSKFVDRIPTREVEQIRSHAQKYFIKHPEHPMNPARISADAAGRVDAEVAAAEAAAANEGGEPPTASVKRLGQ